MCHLALLCPRAVMGSTTYCQRLVRTSSRFLGGQSGSPYPLKSTATMLVLAECSDLMVAGVPEL